MLDAIGDAIALIKAKHSKLKEDELPEHTIFSIMTDGLENASREYSYKRIKDMIELQKKCGWDFIFQAANIDTEYEADRLGIDREMSMSFAAMSDGDAICAALYRYDYCTAKYSLTNFITGREVNNAFPRTGLLKVTSEKVESAVLIVVIASLTLVAAGAFFYFHKRR